MTIARDIADFASRASARDLSSAARDALALRILDALGCAIGALDAEPIAAIRGLEDDFGGRPRCTLVGGGRSAPDRAAFLNGALVRYLDFNDAYLAPRETCHPSDNLAPVLAAAEWAGATGSTLLAALAVAYQVQCRLSDEAPVRDRGFDHVTQGACAVAAGVARALELDPERTANAIAIAVTAQNALRVTRTGVLSNWKGLAYPHVAFAATHATFLAARGITGPLEAFEGNKGFIDAISGPFSIEWGHEDLEAVRHTAVKRFDAEIHAQSAVEAILELADEHALDPRRVARIEADVFGVAHRIIGGGEEGDKTSVSTKEQADHSLPYMLAVALLDRALSPAQYAPERLARRDVQDLLRRVVVRHDPALDARFPAELPCRVRVVLDDGSSVAKEKRDYLGYPSRPTTWQAAKDKFDRLSSEWLEPARRARIAEVVMALDRHAAADLCELLPGTELGALAPEPLTPEVQP